MTTRSLPVSRSLWALTAALACLAPLLSCGGAYTGDPVEDARVLTALLSAIAPGDGEHIAVVYPETQLVLNDRSGENLDAIADRIGKITGLPLYDSRPLLNQLLKRNKRPGSLDLDAPPGANFVVDRRGTYTNFLKSGNEGDWKRMYKDHPEVRAVIHATHPVYDRPNGIALAYIQEMTLSGAGNGSIAVLGYAGGPVKVLGKVVVWSP